MKYVTEYRNRDSAEHYREAIRRAATRPWTLMEVCGGQTHAIMRFGILDLLPPQVILLHGPGCPVCVTPLEAIDKAIAIASLPNVVFCSYGDMLRVPGSSKDLLRVRADGGDIRVIASAMNAVTLAKEHPEKEVVFFAIGFETTAPGHAIAIKHAKSIGLRNFSMLVSHVRVPPAIRHLLSSADSRVNGFLAAGHVCTIMGTSEYESIAMQYKVPIVVAGFEPLDILQSIHMLIVQLESGRAEVENQYVRAVDKAGNRAAASIVEEVMTISERDFRGIGNIAESGLKLRPQYADFDAELRFELTESAAIEPAACISGRILQGLARPTDCAAFGKTCSPDHPMGATMVSSEGACAAYFRYKNPYG